MNQICFIGSGNMAEAMIGGILHAGLFKKDDILASDVSRERLSCLHLKWEIKTTLNKKEDIGSSDIIVLSVKPQKIRDVMDELSSCFKPGALIISILAGVRLEKIEEHLPKNPPHPIARVMPNMNAMVRKSVSAVCYNSCVTGETRQMVEKILSTIGHVHLCEEEQMDAVTAVSGSGPAYLFYFLEIFTEAARELGFSEKESSEFCMETCLGAMELLDKSRLLPAQLREKVTSKSGTTEAALSYLQEKDFRKIFIEAVKAAHRRAEELGKSSS
ncbi:MAG: pyrroline-5-carboxylate reductase [Candidatus Aureabacteria bacterium]|nr:pyrroline-5-carboxylate reductase [Candidatus Auribacterota bacterium]